MIMEIVLAILFTIIVGFLGAFVLSKFSREKVQEKAEVERTENISSEETKALDGVKKLLDDDDDKDLFIKEEDLTSIANCESPLEMREFVRYLRKNEIQQMTEEERHEEQRIQKEQLSNILRLMQKSEDKLGISSMEEMEEQMKLYSEY